MPAYNVHRSIVINVPSEQVFNTVADYGTWTKWSPWLGVAHAGQPAVVHVLDAVEHGDVHRHGLRTRSEDAEGVH
jgi:hypothetical protein